MKHRINIAFLFGGIGASVLLLEGWPMIMSLALIVLTFSVIVSYGVIAIRWNYFLKSLSYWKNDDTLLTFDDGPDPKLTPLVLEILMRHDIRAIFFLIGSKAEKYPEIVKQIVAEGHLIGNHTFSHNNFLSVQSESKVIADLEKCQQVLERITGERPRLFRPPVGYTNPIIGRALRKMKLVCMGWSVRSFDSVIKQEEALVNRLTAHTKPGSVVLLHDNLPVTVQSLEAFIRSARENGIIFVRSFE